jgi:cobalt-zinc-cadmium efflux system outer membrane protein
MKRWILFCLLGAVPAAAGAEPRRITMEEALKLARGSPLMTALDLEVDRAAAEVKASGLYPNPELLFLREEAAGVVDRFATLSFPFPLTGRLSLERDAAASALRATVARTEQARVSIVGATVRDAFVDLLSAQERSAALATGTQQLADLQKVLQAREAAGEASRYDRLRAEREHSEVQADFLQSRGTLERSRRTLAALLAISSESLEAEGTLKPRGELPGAEAVREMARARGDLVALEAEAERADAQARAASRRAVPEPTLTLGAKNSEFGGVDDTGAVAGITFSIPLFDHGQGRSAVATSEAALLRAQRVALLRRSESEAESALAEAVALREAEKAYRVAGNPEELVIIARAAYEAGEMRILELLDAYRTALSARLKAIDLSAGARRAEVELSRSLGTEVVP